MTRPAPARVIDIPAARDTGTVTRMLAPPHSRQDEVLVRAQEHLRRARSFADERQREALRAAVRLREFADVVDQAREHLRRAATRNG